VLSPNWRASWLAVEEPCAVRYWYIAVRRGWANALIASDVIGALPAALSA
jgi:hypothetical protein